MKAYTYIVEVGFEQIPYIFLDQTLSDSLEFEGYLESVWEYICSILSYNKVKNNIVLYKITQNGGKPIAELSAKEDFCKLVDRHKFIFVEVHSKIVNMKKNIVEKVNFHVIINENSKPKSFKVIEKTLFKGELE